jgi:hypothetical protein
LRNVAFGIRVVATRCPDVVPSTLFVAMATDPVSTDGVPPKPSYRDVSIGPRVWKRTAPRSSIVIAV